MGVCLPKRKRDCHKGDCGYVLVLGGSSGLTGAVCLCASAALRSGAGLVRVGVPKSLNHIFEIKLTEVMSIPLAEKDGCLSVEAFGAITSLLNKIDVIALGCGAGAAKGLVLKIIEEVNKPLVIDADGINALAGNPDFLNRRRSQEVVLTPHLGEFSRLTGASVDTIKKKRKALVKDFAFRYNLTLVLKGNRSLVGSGKKLVENSTGNSAMATAGTGDVLTGIIAGLLAQGLSPFDAARTGVYLHGLSADIAVKDKTQNCLIASDIIEYLPKAMKKIK
ncbi:MAG: NAD(P)H-hydrate dehydratase [Candidatus Omnitrophica bacterium]|nr:NAD(P)H-hydrate dehydratase [Candidatus Omnitrophota bacterium]